MPGRTNGATECSEAGQPVYPAYEDSLWRLNRSSNMNGFSEKIFRNPGMCLRLPNTCHTMTLHVRSWRDLLHRNEGDERWQNTRNRRGALKDERLLG